ncbi:hypothetical protein, partial [Serratia liquefaciens]|uniref:hypothetical protein n=1 Tax=Serratia liquefaciens TaxID=614 RepID=UPI00235E0569
CQTARSTQLARELSAKRIATSAVFPRESEESNALRPSMSHSRFSVPDRLVKPDDDSSVVAIGPPRTPSLR